MDIRIDCPEGFVVTPFRQRWSNKVFAEANLAGVPENGQ
jgi:hypothetical protein